MAFKMHGDFTPRYEERAAINEKEFDSGRSRTNHVYLNLL